MDAVFAGEAETKTWNLKDQNEFRFELAGGDSISVKVLNGSAEWFGTELAPEELYTFSGPLSGCLFTWYGCDVQVTGKPAHANIYPKSDTVMASYCAVHSVLEERRKRASETAAPGPRVLIAGPQDCGKSSVTRLLLAYAARLGWTPMLVDLDPGASLIGVPGSLGASVVERPPYAGESFKEEGSLQYFYGSMNLSHNPALLELLLRKLGENVAARLDKTPHARASGFVVNTMACSGEAERQLVLQAVEELKIDVVIVLGQRLFRELQESLKHCKQPGVEAVHLKPSGGIEARDHAQRSACLKHFLKDYFYGSANELSPKRQTRHFGDMHIYEMGGAKSAPSSALPIGEDSSVDPLALLPVSYTPETLMHVLCAVSLATTLEEVRDAPVGGYVLISEVDVYKQTITFLSPTSGVPGSIFIVGSLPHFEL